MKQYILRIFVLLFLFVSNILMGQEITWGPEYKELYLDTDKSLVAEGKDHFFLTKHDANSKWYIERYNKDELKRDYSARFMFSADKNGKGGLEFLWLVGDTMCVIYSGDFSDEYEYLYMSKVNVETGKPYGEDVEIYKTNISRDYERCEYYTTQSPDMSKHLIVCQVYDYYGYNTRSEYVLMNNEMEILAKRKENYGRYGRGFNIGSHLLENDGTFYYMKMGGGQALLTSFDGMNSYEEWWDLIDLTEQGLDLDANFHGIRMTLNAKDEIVITAYYYIDELQGYLYMTVDKESKEILEYKVVDLEMSFFEEWASRKRLEAGDILKIDYLFNLQYIMKKDDGGLVIVGERFYRRDAYPGYKWCFKDLAVFNLDPEGELLWAKRVPKSQIFDKHASVLMVGTAGSLGQRSKYPYSTDDYFSILPALKDNELHIFYNDNPDYLDQLDKWGEAAPEKKISRMNLIHRTMDLDSGEMTTEVMTKEEAPEMKMMVSFSKQKNNDDKIITYSLHRKKFRLGMMEL